MEGIEVSAKTVEDAVLEAAIHRDGEVAHRNAVAGGAHLRITRQVANQIHLVHMLTFLLWIIVSAGLLGLLGLGSFFDRGDAGRARLHAVDADDPVLGGERLLEVLQVDVLLLGVKKREKARTPTTERRLMS